MNEENVPDEAKKYKAADSQKELFRLSDASGSMKFSLAKKGQVSKADLDSKVSFLGSIKLKLDKVCLIIYVIPHREYHKLSPEL